MLKVGLRQRLASRKDGFLPPKATLLERWTRHDAGSDQTIDHAAWARFLDGNLRTFEDGMNLIPYSRVSEADSSLLDDYVNAMGRLAISEYARDEQLAYWINLYNARTVQLVLAYFPVDDLRQIKLSPGRHPFGPWDKTILIIEGEQLTLNDVQHRILRPIWKDGRLHYALNRGAIGSPNLQRQPFSASNAEDLFEQGARAFINHPRGAHIDDGKLVISRLYLWYYSEFGGSVGRVLDHLRKYASLELEAELAAAKGIDDYDYYWGINEAP